MYGHDGEYEQRLREAGFDVTVVPFARELGSERARRYRLMASEDIYFCRDQGRVRPEGTSPRRCTSWTSGRVGASSWLVDAPRVPCPNAPRSGGCAIRDAASLRSDDDASRRAPDPAASRSRGGHASLRYVFMAGALQSSESHWGIPTGSCLPARTTRSATSRSSRSCEFDETLLGHLGGAWDQPPVLDPGWAQQSSLDPFRASVGDHR